MTSIPEISARGSLILWAKFQIPVGPRPCAGPRSGREGEKCRPLDHMRHIPFIHQLCSHPTLRPISIYIQNLPCYFFHVVFTLCLETLYICYLRMRFSKTTYFKVIILVTYLEVILSPMWYVLIQRYTTIKTWHRCVAIWRWCSQRANFTSIRKETVLNTQWLRHTTVVRMAVPNVLSTHSSNFLRQRGRNSIQQSLARSSFS